MGALRLADLHVAQTGFTPEETAKRGGSGGGDGTFYEMAGRIHCDERATPMARELLLALAYAVREYPDDTKAVWRLARRSMGVDRAGIERANQAIAADAPRYLPHGHGYREWDPLKNVCHGPRVQPYQPRGAQHYATQRAKDAEDFRNELKICGATADIKVVEKLPETGWHKIRYYCTRHTTEADRLREQVGEQNKRAPEPIPNRGGLLPCYFDADWLSMYRKHTGPHYKPPIYGLCADAWPVPGKEPVPPRPRLRLVLPPDDEEP